MSATIVEALVSSFRARAFTPRVTTAPRRIGAEVEVIPVHVATREAVRIVECVPMLRRLALQHHWVERPSAYGAPIFVLPNEGELSFEPGGQLEFSAVPSTSVSELVARIQRVIGLLSATAEAHGVVLLSLGVDPNNPVSRVPLQLPGERYIAMDAYLATIGPNGARMMRQTAAFQVSLDVGADPVSEWRLLNALAPYLIALFANSARYEGRETGAVSYRAHIWRTLDRTRTGLPAAGDGDDAAAAYVAWALEAPAILRRDRSGAFRPFGELLAAGDATIDDWPTHLTTLFPEVRPRGNFEMRSPDAIGPAFCSAPLVLLAGLCYDPRAFREAADVLKEPDPSLLETAGQLGLKHPAVADVAMEIVRIALAGAERLGPAIISLEDMATASELLRSKFPLLR